MKVVYAIVLLIVSIVVSIHRDAESLGVIKDLYNKLTHTNNKTEETVKQSAPICGSGIFSTPDERSLSPEIIFITNRRSESISSGSTNQRESYDKEGSESTRRRHRDQQESREVSKEFRFHEENVTIEALRSQGFNPEAPTTFLMHGFTSGYPLQAWISAIVEAYSLDRRSSHGNLDDYRHQQHNEQHRPSNIAHNLFIVNWNYAARGLVYPRAVANIPIVASYVTRFINKKLLDEARVDPNRVQLIGHSLGAHLAGFIGKNTKSKLGRIYGLDPAGPCFGAISGPLYPSSKRLAPSDATEVITIHTNTALLGIDKPLGRYSVYVEGGSVQPGCKGGKVFSSIETLTLDGGSLDSISCSHSRAPNLLTYRHDQSDTDDDCQLVAYECKDFDSFVAGHCGTCAGSSDERNDGSLIKSVECLRIGLDWQYPGKEAAGGSHSRPTTGYQNSGYTDSDYNNQNHRQTSSTRRPSTNDYDREDQNSGYNSDQRSTTTRRPYSDHTSNHSASYSGSNSHHHDRTSTYRPASSDYANTNREKRETSHHQNRSISEERRQDNRGESVEAKKLFLRTGDTQPYCSYHYQVILELHEPFQRKKPPMSLLLQDSLPDNERRGSSSSRSGENSLSSDDFGNKYSDKIYTQLLTSGRKLHKIDHGTLLFREGLNDGHKLLKSLQINYMSNESSAVRKRLSSHLCPVKTNTNQHNHGHQSNSDSGNNRFFFEPCENHSSSYGSSTQGYESSSSYGYSSSRRPTHNQQDNNYSSTRRPSQDYHNGNY